MSNLEALVCNLLKCGPADLAMLEQVGFDWPDVIEATGWKGGSFTDMDFNSLMDAVVYLGKMALKDAVKNRMSDLESLEKRGELTSKGIEELFRLIYLDPEEDIQSFHNYLDTHVWFEKNGVFYRKYLSDALDDFADNVGIEITGGEESE